MRVRNARLMSFVMLCGQWEPQLILSLSRAMTMAPSDYLCEQVTAGQKKRWEEVRRFLCFQVGANEGLS